MNEEKKEECPLCEVSEDTIKNLENAGSNKKDKYLLKKQEREQANLLKKNKKKNRKMMKFSVIALVAILVIGGVGFKIVRSFQERNFGPAKVEVTELRYNAGTVSMADGLVEHTYEIKNIGEGDLKLKNIKTSCMCTTVRLRVGDKLSPEFGMNTNTIGWSEIVPPGEMGYLEVAYDPNFHGPTGTGPVTRAIYVSTNDSDNKNLEFMLLADVIN